MSTTGIRKCDRCAKEFLPELGCLRIDVNFYTDIDTAQGWADIDLCEECAAPIIERIRPACNDLSDILPMERA